MSKQAVGIILAGGKNERLGELTSLRATGAIPIGSCYRAVDFTLSNMTNSGVNKVAVITQYNSRSLHDHLSSSKWWDFGRKQGGLFVFTPFLSNDNNFWFRGTADGIFQNISFLKRSNEPYVIIVSGDGVYKMDYQDVIEAHEKSGADITIVCKDMAGKDVRDFGVVTLDENMKMTDFEEKPMDPQSETVSLGIYVVSRIMLIKLLETIIAEDRYDFVKDIIVRYRRRLSIYGHKFDGYWSPLNTIASYFETNMDFLKKDVRDLLVHQRPHIETKPKDEPPAKYNGGSRVKNSLVGSGSILNGLVQDSVLFRRVFSGDSSQIKNSIVMEGSFIGNNCVVEYAILDKDVILSDGKRVVGTRDEPKIIGKGMVV